MIALNPERWVRDRRDALDAALSLPVAPACRLPLELLAFLRKRKPDVDPQPDVARYVADGTFERHLEA